MFKRISIWWYVKQLIRKHKKDDQWIISPEYLHDVVNGFDPNWLSEISYVKVREMYGFFHHKRYCYLRRAIAVTTKAVNEKASLVNSATYEFLVEGEFITVGNFFLDEKEIPYDILASQNELRHLTVNFLMRINALREENEIHAEYYIRNTRKLMSDIIEVYSTFLNTTNMK